MTMRQPFRGTDHLSAGEFLNKIAGIAPGEALIYATGDLAHGAAIYPDIFALRSAVWKLYESRQIALTQRPRRDRGFAHGGRAFDYIATKRAPETKKEVRHA